MINEQYPSKLLEHAVQELTRLPGVGRKTALRYALYLLAQDKDTVHNFSNSLTHLCDDVKHCKVCHNISDTEVCDICSNTQRDRTTICVVENIHSVMSIENTGQYHGLYHVLGGVISPMDGIGPSNLELDSLFKRVEEGSINEIILALNPTMEGDTTNFFKQRLNTCTYLIYKCMGCSDHLCPFMRKRPTAYRIRNGQRTDGIYAQPTLHRTNTYMHLGQSTTFCYKESTQQHFKQN